MRFLRILLSETLEDMSYWFGDLADRVDPYYDTPRPTPSPVPPNLS